MVTAMVAAVGVALMAGFCWAWPPGGLLLAGLGLLWLAAVRSDNERRQRRAGERR